jgi:hypothetical protein
VKASRTVDLPPQEQASAGRELSRKMKKKRGRNEYFLKCWEIMGLVL